jgi:hypothetical protein
MEYELLMKRMIDRPYQLDSSTILRRFLLKMQFFLGSPAEIAENRRRKLLLVLGFASMCLLDYTLEFLSYAEVTEIIEENYHDIQGSSLLRISAISAG